MVAPSFLLCLAPLVFCVLLLVALVLLASLASLVDESQPDRRQQIRTIGRQARHTARRASEEYLRRASELLTETRQSR